MINWDLVWSIVIALSIFRLYDAIGCFIYRNLSNRRDKTGTKMKTKCSKCGYVFSYEAEDVVNEDNHNPYIVRSHVICPQCGKPVFTRPMVKKEVPE